MWTVLAPVNKATQIKSDQIGAAIRHYLRRVSMNFSFKRFNKDINLVIIDDKQSCGIFRL